jgi:hypothetical protein
MQRFHLKCARDWAATFRIGASVDNLVGLCATSNEKRRILERLLHYICEDQKIDVVGKEEECGG